MDKKSLTNDEIRQHISLWMSELFNNNVHADNVKIAVTKAIEKVVTLKLKNDIVDIEKLNIVFREIKP